MILRRIKAHVEKENWFAVGIDFLIVVVGVFMGIQLGNWNQERIDGQEEIALVERIRVDFNRIEADSDRSLAFHERMASDFRTMVRSLRSGTLEDKDVASFERALVLGIGLQTSADNSGSFSEMMSSGRAHIFRDRDLLNAMVDYEDFLERFEAAGEYYREIIILSIPDYTSAFEYGVDFQLTEGVSSLMGEERSRVSYDFEALVADAAFQNAAEQLMFVHSGLILWRSRISQRVEGIQDLLNNGSSGSVQ